MKQIIVTVTSDGGTQIETRGFQGADCQAGSQFLEEALGRRSSEQLTAEFHESETTHQQNRQTN
jgi:hypothetical protein